MTDTTGIKFIANEIGEATTDLSHLAYMKLEGRELPKDAAEAVRILERLTEYVKLLYEITGGRSSQQNEDH